jgi:hypothetical protein
MEVAVSNNALYQMDDWIVSFLDAVAILFIIIYLVWTAMFALKVIRKWANLQQRYRLLFILNMAIVGVCVLCRVSWSIPYFL